MDRRTHDHGGRGLPGSLLALEEMGDGPMHLVELALGVAGSLVVVKLDSHVGVKPDKGLRFGGHDATSRLSMTA